MRSAAHRHASRGHIIVKQNGTVRKASSNATQQQRPDTDGDDDDLAFDGGGFRRIVGG